MEEWKTYKLKDLTVDGKGHYGIGAPAVEYDENKFTYLRITDINDDGSLNYTGLKSVDNPEAGKYLLKEGDIVFARTGNSTGRSYFYEPSDGQFVFAGFLIKFSIDSSKVNPRFLKYYTHSKPYYEWVQSFDTGATRGNINAQTFGSMEINLPPRDVQDRLVEILSSLDKKIKLNLRINHNLEEQAQALFSHWLNNCEDKVAISELCDNILDYTPITAKRVVALNSSDVTEGVFAELSYTPISEIKGQFKKRFEKGDILYSEIRPRNLHYAYCYFNPMDYIASTRLMVIRSKSEKLYSSVMLYQYLQMPKVFEEFTSKTESRSGTFPQGNFKDLSSSIVPYSGDNEEISIILESLYKLIWKNIDENKSLSSLRDSLLPILMSGELKINDLTC